MLRPLVVVALVAALLVPVGVASAGGGSSPTGAVRLHYRHIAKGDFKPAYALFTAAAKKQLGPYAKWKAGYAETGQVTVYDLKRDGNRVRGSITACRSDGAREVTIEERFSATWPTKRIKGRWYLDAGAKIRRTSSRETSRCMLPIP